MSTAMGRPREHDAATRDRLLAAATRLSAEEGWRAVSVRRVAEEAGTSTRAVYSLFGSKQGLDQELHLAMFERLLELMRATPRTADPQHLPVDVRGFARQDEPRRRFQPGDRRFGVGGQIHQVHGGAAAHLLAQRAGEALQGALRRCEIAGVATNLALHERLVRHPEFVAGGVGTAFLGNGRG